MLSKCYWLDFTKLSNNDIFILVGQPHYWMGGIMNKTVEELEQALITEAEWVMERLSTSTESNDRNYYQGRIDQLAQVRRLILT